MIGTTSIRKPGLAINYKLYQSLLSVFSKVAQAKLLRHRTASNIVFDYYKLGPDFLPKIIYLHGFGDSKEGFILPSLGLIRDFQVIIPDLPGFGQRFDENLTYNSENYKKWLLEFVEEMGFEDFHLIGNSLGGALSLELALEIPERIKTLTVLGSAGVYLEEYESIYDQILEGKNIFHVKERSDFDELMSGVFHKKPTFTKLMDRLVFEKYKSRASSYGIIMDNIRQELQAHSETGFEAASLNSKVSQIKSPTLIIWGRQDNFFPVEMGYFMRDQIKDSILHVFEETGHCPHLERPSKFCSAVKDFVRKYED